MDIQLISGICGGTLTEVACADVVGGSGTSFATETISGIILTVGMYYIKLNNEGGGSSMSIQNFCVTTTISANTLPSLGNNSYILCSGIIQDNGGSGNYSNSVSGYSVINPSIAGNMVSLTFIEFALECCCDYVNIYDGSGIGLLSKGLSLQLK